MTEWISVIYLQSKYNKNNLILYMSSSSGSFNQIIYYLWLDSGRCPNQERMQHLVLESSLGCKFGFINYMPDRLLQPCICSVAHYAYWQKPRCEKTNTMSQSLSSSVESTVFLVNRMSCLPFVVSFLCHVVLLLCRSFVVTTFRLLIVKEWISFFWGLLKCKLHWVACKVNEPRRGSWKLC